MKHQSYQKYLKDVVIIATGNFLLACAVVYFVIPFNILSGGVAGVAIAFGPLIPFPPAVTINILIVSMFLLGSLVLGKSFALKTILSAILYPLFLHVLGFFPLFIEIDPILASLYAGIIGGLGIGIVYRTNASTGGMDIPPLIINKFTNIPVGTLVGIVDSLTIGFGLWYFGLEQVLIGLISVFSTTMVVNRVLVAGGKPAKTVLIISKQFNEISTVLQNELKRGVTIIDAKGGYSFQDRPILLTVVYSKQYPKLYELVHSVDETAFVVVIDTTEVKGEGFSFGYKI